MKSLLSFFCPWLALLGLTISLRADAPAAPIQLFNGKDLTGWTLVTHQPSEINAICHVTADGSLASAGKPVGYLLSTANYRNYKIHFEWRWPVTAPKNTNGGLLVYVVGGPVDRHTWPVCFQVQTKATRAGDLLPMAGATFAEPLSTPPGAKTPQLDRQKPASEKPFGEWNVCDAVCRDGTIECTINGVFQNRVTGCKPAAGLIGFQLEGFPWEMRNIWIEPLN